jgi:serine phosphatase RsbU (regulator of sigma subunit)
MNSDSQEWGEERLARTVMSGCALEPMALIGRLMGEADLVVGSAPQHDDMTLVVARCG